jgi:hypothetical protein
MRPANAMEFLIARCAGLDVHQATVVATVRAPDDRGGRRRVTETFGTMTPDLLALREWLRGTLVQAGLAATRSNGTALQAGYHRVKRHRGHKKAVAAVGHQILEIAYYVMRDGRSYHELGADYFDKRHAERAVRRHVRQLEALEFHVTIEKAA